MFSRSSAMFSPIELAFLFLIFFLFRFFSFPLFRFFCIYQNKAFKPNLCTFLKVPVLLQFVMSTRGSATE
jgi:hypothetical protein